MMETFARVLLQTSMRGAVLIALAWIATALQRRRSAELRHVVWLTSLIGTLALPALAWAPRWSLPILPVPAATVIRATSVDTRSSLRVEAVEKPVAPARGSFVLLLVWLLGCVVLLTREIASRRRVHRWIVASRPAGAEVQGACDRVARRLGLRRHVACRRSPLARVPMVCGVWRPVVILPEASADWGEPSLRRVLLHELAHVQRHDPLWIAVGHAARALLWFHPLVWLAVARSRAESECACDDRVVSEGERPSGYAQTLLSIADPLTLGEMEAALPLATHAGLETRIMGILSPIRDRRALGVAPRLAVLGAAALLALAIAVAQPVGAASPAPSEATAPPAVGSGSSEWLSGAADVERRSVRFLNLPQSPVQVVAATARIVPRAEDEESGLTLPEIALTNHDPSRRVIAVQLALDLPTTHDRISCSVSVPANGTTHLLVPAHQWSAVAPSADEGRLVVHVAAVWFDRGEPWDSREERPAAPPVPKARASSGATPQPAAPSARPSGSAAILAETFSDASYIRARFRNPADAPLVITEARTPVHGQTSEGREMTFLPEVQLQNRSAHTATAVKLRFKADRESHAVTFVQGPIGPGQSVVVRKIGFEAWGRAADMTVQVVGVDFDDGSVWGSMDSLIDARDPWVYPLTDDSR
jgi:beta-lactamase regulating signal transducer with metallopeptidase domain